jgi:hypothetical protein
MCVFERVVCWFCVCVCVLVCVCVCVVVCVCVCVCVYPASMGRPAAPCSDPGDPRLGKTSF